MPATVFYDTDADLQRLQDKTIAVIGYGNQGRAHALNLHDSGLQVIIGLYEGSKSWHQAETDGLQVVTVANATQQADILMLLLPDELMGDVYTQHMQAHIQSGQTLMFAHGFSIRYELILPPSDIDVSMIAPKGPGRHVRTAYQGNSGLPALVAIHQDASGDALANALAYAKGIGCTRAGVIQTTFAEETETDLFGEQVVLTGGITALVRASFETLVKAGYQPEVAYFECLHEVKLIADLLQTGGLSYMWESVSNTAEYGGYIAGERMVSDDIKEEMMGVLTDIQDGTFARHWMQENRAGRTYFNNRRQQEYDLLLEQVGKQVRSMIPTLGDQSKTGGE